MVSCFRIRIALLLVLGQIGVLATLSKSGTMATMARREIPKEFIKGSLASRPIYSNNTANCSLHITPSCIQKLYNIPTTTIPKPGKYTDVPKVKTAVNKVDKKYKSFKNGLLIPGFLDEYANYADLNHFLSAFRPDLQPPPKFQEKLLDKGKNSQILPGGLDANLGVQYAFGIGNGINVTFMSSGLSDVEGFLKLGRAVLKQKKKADPPRLGQEGVSVIVSSGNGGVSGIKRTEECTTFLPSFPAGCPWVTVVGGTSGIPTETAANFSAGGFANLFGRPTYQNAAVTRYLNKSSTVHSGKFNDLGRGYPDVAALSTNIVIYRNGKEELVDGTPAGAIIFASIIALLNAELIGQYKPVLGFLNPWLYDHPEMFNDIKTGSNPGCGTDGFPATEGWDPITGLGTPSYKKMKEVLGL
ncbi:Tripeptidyl-peptidase SED2 [Cladobotryum mycophilum]|uniref:Tripeptidyl-peptidase SED2 n=1 Tax=Cladobotryum mycophilum TaxID=491253 RepID=A0ABR0SIB8_9HYPO